MDKNAELSRLFYREILKIHSPPAPKEGVPPPQYEIQIQALYQLLHTIFCQVTMQERVPFNTFFARIAFAFQKYEVPTWRQMTIHNFRKTVQNIGSQYDAASNYQLGLRACADAVKIFFQEDPSVELLNLLPPHEAFRFKTADVSAKIPLMRVVILSDDKEKEQFIGRDEATGEEVRIQYNIAERNENFRKTIAVIRHIFGYPTTLHLIDSERIVEDVNGIEKGIIRPRAFVVEPDYLVDVTATAECFRRDIAEPLLHLLTKFLPYEATPSIMKGNIANFFLDELVANPDVNYLETYRKTFKLNPLAFCRFEEAEVRQIFSDAKGHFIHLKLMVTEGFEKAGIERESCYLEPSFYAPKYGLQGRLDLFYQNPFNQKTAIVELKSGKPFRPNVYGISNNHFTQTLLYDLLVEAAFGQAGRPLCYILYSVLAQDNLKYAPVLRSQQFEALNIRNQILALEQALINLNRADGKAIDIFKRLIYRLAVSSTGFEKRDIDLFAQTYHGMSALEKKYFAAFAAFTAREHQISKMGMDDFESANGLASLWLDLPAAKEQNFAIFSRLKIRHNQSQTDDPQLVFEKTEQTNALANFRVGDIVVLYPNAESTEGFDSLKADSRKSIATEGGILKNQIFKCSIVAMDKETVTLRLRSRQMNQDIFTANEFWDVEHDLLDSSFNGMYRGLFAFAQSAKRKRNLLLTIDAPRQPEGENRTDSPSIGLEGLTDEQNHILQKILNSEDYFLLWGPPGTGKTSVMLKNLVGHLLANTHENILLLAYTNRAVDEICEAIESLGDWVKSEYVRIGSRYGTSPPYHNQLLDRKIDAVTTRKELVSIIKGHRIYVATVASMTGKMELMQLTKFHRVIIDEASQILEPQLVGLLPYFEHFTLIGDHKQLPAVVQQPEAESQTQDTELQAIGLKNLRNSFFERLFKRAVENKWTWAYDILSHQGRMHDEIMQFPSHFFYEEKLRILPDGMNAFQLQSIDFQFNAAEINSYNFEKILSERRVVFLNTETDLTNGFNKTNAHEAKLIGLLVKTFEKIYAAKNRRIHPLSIGVITPYRAQIAQIQASLREIDFAAEQITIDTVERYQGGAREVILISLCTNEATQLAALVSLSEEGVDRKLNVALTRARQHLVVIGNAEILRGSPIYRAFIEKYQY